MISEADLITLRNSFKNEPMALYASFLLQYRHFVLTLII